MIKTYLKRLMLGAITLSFLWLPGALPVSAAPEISGVSMRYCGSLRIPENGWAYLYYDIRNPDPHPVNLRLVLQPQGQVNITIYEHLLTLPAESRFRSRVPVTIGRVQTYTVSLFQDNHLIGADELMLSVPDRELERKLEQQQARGTVDPELERGIAMGSERFVFFINDNFDLSYGNFAKNQDLHFRYLTSTVKSEDVPEHFSGFGSAHMLVIQDPNFESWNSRQFNALQDYVARGGALLFAGPLGVMKAYEETTLRRMLPVEPLRQRKLEQLDSLKTLGGSALAWPNGADFLESVAIGDGIETLSHQDFPLLRWKRYGLGYVGVSAVNPSDPAIQQSENFAKLWNHIFSFGGNNIFASGQGDHALATALDTITGVKIPQASYIQLFLLGYMVLVVLFIGGGMLTRMRMQAWIGLGVIAIATTILIFHFANRRAAMLSTRTAAILDFRVEGVYDVSGEKLVSLFLKREEVITLRSPSVDNQMRSLIPPPRVAEDQRIRWEQAVGDEEGAATRAVNPIVASGAANAVRDPLRISLIGDHASLRELKLLQQMPRFYGVLYTRSAVPEWQVPVVEWQLDGPRMAPWEIPASITAQFAYLVCENGYFPVRIDNGYCSITDISQGVGFLEAPPEIVALRSFLAARAVPAPMLVLIGNIASDPTEILPDDFDVLGRRISMVPISEDRTADVASVPFRRMKLQTGRTSRLLRTDDHWQPESSLRGDDTKDYDFHAYLPPGYNQLKPNTLRIRFEADNRGKNVQYAIYLVDPAADPADEARFITPASVSDNVYTFDNLAADLIDSTDGRFEFIIRASTIQSVSNPNVAARMNTWIVRELDIAADGTLPPETRGRL